MKEITSINNEYIKKLCKLKEKKYRDEEKLFIVEGYHLVKEAKEYLQEVLITKEEDYIEGVSNILVTDNIIEKLSSVKTPQKIIGICKYFDKTEVTGDKFLILDGVQDPGNLGTLIRTALGFKIDTIICSLDTVSIYNEKVIRATQGAIFNINYVIGDLKEIINKLKKDNVSIISTSLENGTELKKVNLDEVNKYGIILGNEGNGVRKDIQELATFNVRIEMDKRLESLNVGVAGAILMYYMMK